jgi:WD40 repeat protein
VPDVNAATPSVYHKDIISAVKYVPDIDKYATGSRDGTFKLWNAADFQHTRTFQNCKGSWVSDLCVLPEKRLAVSASDRSISFYGIYRQNLELTGRLFATGMMGTPLCMSAAVIGEQSRLMFGDSKGAVRMLKCDIESFKDGVPRSMIKDDYTVVHDQHTDWCTKVMYVPELSAVISSSMDSKIKVVDVNTNFGANGSFRVRQTVGLHSKGVYDFDWCSTYSIFISAGVERDIMLWHGNTGHKVGSLAGHTASVSNVVVDNSLHQVISLSTDKTIKIWDLRTNRCIQTMEDENTYRPEDRIAVLLHDPKRRQLVTGTTRLRPWKQVLKSRESEGHNSAVVGCLYNFEFDVAVSADENCDVYVWNVNTGQRDERFTDAHPNSRITALVFDTLERRLLTGANDGTVRMWNHNNGQLLKELVHREEPGEVTQLLYVMDEHRDAKVIVAVGWNRKIVIWNETEDHVLDDYRVLLGHDEDILCAAFCAGTTMLATGDYSGKVLLWNIFSGFKRAALQIHSSNAYNAACERLCFLAGRADVEEGPVLVSGGSDGNLRVWLTNRPGINIPDSPGSRPVAVIRAAAENEDITALKTDPTNSYLFTGDSAGHVHVFDISQINLATDFTAASSFIELGAWRPHTQAITTVEYLPSRKLLMIASVDTDVTLWTLEGKQVGTFGQTTPWRAQSAVGTSWRNTEAQRHAAGGDTRDRGWALDEMVGDSLDDVAMKEAKMTALVNALLRGKGPTLREKTAEEREKEEDVPLEPQDAARRYLEARRVAGQQVGWRNYEHQMVHSFLGIHKLQKTPTALMNIKQELFEADGSARHFSSPPVPAKERERKMGRTLKKFNDL